MNQSENERVVVFGGTFDPPHAGHMGVAKLLLHEFQLVVLAPTSQNPFKNHEATILADRVEMLKLMVKAYRLPLVGAPHLRGIYVSTFPYTRTYEFVDHWAAKENERVAWAIGPDLRDQVKTWAKWDEMNLHLIEKPEIGDGSLHSELIRAGKTPFDPAIREYIEERKLYRHRK